MRRRNSNYLKRSSSQRNIPPDDIRIGSELPPPECVAQDRDRMRTRQTIVICLDGAADQGVDSQRFEVVSGDDFDIDESGVAWTHPNRLFHRSRRDAGEDRHLTKRLINLITRFDAGLYAVRSGQDNELFR